MRTILVTSDKGGCFKTGTALLQIDYCRRYGLPVVAADAESAAIQASLFDRIRSIIPENEILSWELATNAGYRDMVNDFDKMMDQDGFLICDTGASMLSALQDNLELLAGARDEIGVDLEIVFLVSALPESANAAYAYLMAQKTLDNPLSTTFLLVDPAKTKQEKYIFSSDGDVQKAIAETGAKVEFLGTLEQSDYNLIMLDKRLPKEILEDKTKDYGTRKQLSIWLSRTLDPILKRILGV